MQGLFADRNLLFRDKKSSVRTNANHMELLINLSFIIWFIAFSKFLISDHGLGRYMILLTLILLNTVGAYAVENYWGKIAGTSVCILGAWGLSRFVFHHMSRFPAPRCIAAEEETAGVPYGSKQKEPNETVSQEKHQQTNIAHKTSIRSSWIKRAAFQKRKKTEHK